MRRHARILGATALAAAVAVIVPVMTSSEAHAARFTGGDLVVYRVGSGSAALTNAAAPVFLDEYSAAGAKLQSVALPTTASEGNSPLTASGQSRSEGLIDRSADGRFIALTGYGATVGTTGGNGASLTTTAPGSVPRVVGLVDANGTVDTTTRLDGAGTPKIIRSGTTVNGERLWATGGNGGILTSGTAELTAAAAARSVAWSRARPRA